MKKYANFFICSLLILLFIEIFDHTKLIINIFYEATISWYKNLLPTLFPFFLITDLLSNYGFVEFISKMFGKIMKLFKLPEKTSYAFFMSMFSGFPGNSKLIKELLDNNEITQNDANKLLTLTHFSNPLFIIGTIGIIFLNNQKLGILILIVHYLTNFINGLLFRNIYQEKNIINNKKERKTLPLIKTLLKSINNAINAMFLIYGIIIFTSLLTNIITINLHLSSFQKSILTSFLEITQGLKLIVNESITISQKVSLITFFLSFGGISIHMQVMGILSDYKINYKIYLLSRIIHASISSLIIYFILELI